MKDLKNFFGKHTSLKKNKATVFNHVQFKEDLGYTLFGNLEAAWKLKEDLGYTFIGGTDFSGTQKNVKQWGHGRDTKLMAWTGRTRRCWRGPTEAAGTGAASILAAPRQEQ